MQSLTLIQPDDWHVHLRDGAMLKLVVPHTANQFARAMVMPNLKTPITTVAMALRYREEILAAVPEGLNFQPLMSLYLTQQTCVADVKQVAESKEVYAFKLYPAGATTNSNAGINDFAGLNPIFEALQKYNVPLLIHGEVTDADCDIFDRERVFIERILEKLVRQFPELRIVLEHVTTAEAVQFVESSTKNIAATITPQHLLYNRNALLAGGIRPHHYCLPVLKREKHRLALVQAAISGNPQFFLGTDSAPHQQSLKETACGCAGCYSAHAAIELYAQIFEQENALDKLEGFASQFGADFYQLPRNTQMICLEKMTWKVPENYQNDQARIIPLEAKHDIFWRRTNSVCGGMCA
jgi:dihydroorotase